MIFKYKIHQKRQSKLNNDLLLSLDAVKKMIDSYSETLGTECANKVTSILMLRLADYSCRITIYLGLRLVIISGVIWSFAAPLSSFTWKMQKFIDCNTFSIERSNCYFGDIDLCILYREGRNFFQTLLSVLILGVYSVV